MTYEVRVASSNPRYVDYLRYWLGDQWVMLPSSSLPPVSAASGSVRQKSPAGHPSPVSLSRGSPAAGGAATSGVDFWAKVTVRRGMNPNNQQYIQAEYPPQMLEAIKKGRITNFDGMKAAMKPHIENRFTQGFFQFPLWLRVNNNITYVSGFQFEAPPGERVTPQPIGLQPLKLRKGKKFWVQVRVGVSSVKQILSRLAELMTV